MIVLSFRAIRAPELAQACSHSNEGAPMSRDFRSVASAESSDQQGVDTQSERERLITALATSLAVLIVAAIAVLMGMA